MPSMSFIIIIFRSPTAVPAGREIHDGEWPAPDYKRPDCSALFGICPHTGVQRQVSQLPSRYDLVRFSPHVFSRAKGCFFFLLPGPSFPPKFSVPFVCWPKVPPVPCGSDADCSLKFFLAPVSFDSLIPGDLFFFCFVLLSWMQISEGRRFAFRMFFPVYRLRVVIAPPTSFRGRIGWKPGKLPNPVPLFLDRG